MASINQIRRVLGLTQKALAEKLNCSQGTISYYESGAVLIPPGVASKVIEMARESGLPLTFDHIYGDASLPDPAPTEEAANA